LNILYSPQFDGSVVIQDSIFTMNYYGVGVPAQSGSTVGAEVKLGSHFCIPNSLVVGYQLNSGREAVV
jgi:hypothetical protein